MFISIRILLPAVLIFVTVLGSTKAQTRVDLKDPQPGSTAVGHAQDGGMVQAWHVQIGDPVKVGDLIVSLENERQKYAFDIAKLKAQNTAPLESAMGELKKRQAALTEGQGRRRRRLITDEQFTILEGETEIAQANLKQANLNKKMAKLDMELAEKLLERRYIRSPSNGTVVAITKVPGEQVRPGEDLVTVADFSNLAVEIPLNGSSLSTLKPGDSFLVQTTSREPASRPSRLSPVASPGSSRKQNGQAALRQSSPGQPGDLPNAFARGNRERSAPSSRNTQEKALTEACVIRIRCPGRLPTNRSWTRGYRYE